MKEIRPHLWISCLLVLGATHAFGRCRDTVVPGASINQISIGMNQKDLEKIREGGPQESNAAGAKVITIGSTQVTLVGGVVQSLSTDFPQASRFCILVSGKRLTSKSSLNELKKLYAPCDLKTSASGQQLACLSGAINFVFGGKNGELSTVSVSRGKAGQADTASSATPDSEAGATIFDLGPECFKSGPYNKSDQSSECLIQGQARVYLRSHPPRPPQSRQEHEEIDCRQPPQNNKRRGVLVGQEFVNSLSEVHLDLTDKCFWVPSVEATLFNSRRLIKVLKAKKVYSLAELPKLGCSEVWSACRVVEPIEAERR